MDIVRKGLNGLKADEAVENVLNMFARTRFNSEFGQTTPTKDTKKTSPRELVTPLLSFVLYVVSFVDIILVNSEFVQTIKKTKLV
mgnify:CR=1 FL=1